MSLDAECVPCIMNQAYRAAKNFSDGDLALQLKILREVCRETEHLSLDYSAPLFSSRIQDVIERNVGITNPYGRMKNASLVEVIEYMPSVRSLIDASVDRLQTAIRIAIAGNTIDLAANPHFDIRRELDLITPGGIDLSAYSRFSDDFGKAKLILYIGDNFEEALFDMILINELLPKSVVFAVRSRPVLNDITLEDARQIGLDRICPVVESGSMIAGTDLTRATPEFRELYRDADLVIAKGQGNYETLMDEKRPIYFMLKVKCAVISRRTGLDVGSSALIFNEGKRA